MPYINIHFITRVQRKQNFGQTVRKIGFQVEVENDLTQLQLFIKRLQFYFSSSEPANCRLWSDYRYVTLGRRLWWSNCSSIRFCFESLPLKTLYWPTWLTPHKRLITLGYEWIDPFLLNPEARDNIPSHCSRINLGDCSHERQPLSAWFLLSFSPDLIAHLKCSFPFQPKHRLCHSTIYHSKNSFKMRSPIPW